jgi:hypothetical protein
MTVTFEVTSFGFFAVVVAALPEAKSPAASPAAANAASTKIVSPRRIENPPRKSQSHVANRRRDLH